MVCDSPLNVSRYVCEDYPTYPSIPAYDEGNEQWIVVFVHAFVILIGMVQNASRRATVSCKLFAKGPLITDIHLSTLCIMQYDSRFKYRNGIGQGSPQF